MRLRLRLMLGTSLLLLLALPLPAGEGGAGPATDAVAEPVGSTGNAEAEKTDARPAKGGDSLPEQMYESFARGGTVMWLLLATSIVGLTFALERLVALRRTVHVPPGLMEEVESSLTSDGWNAARNRVKDREAALARVIDGLLAREGANREEMERVLEDEAGRVLWDLRRNVRPVGIVASVAPLLGLLGTVFGMINAFKEAADKGMDDPANFAEGIYMALYTTAFGLTIAIPFLIGYHYLRGKADVIMREVEDLCIRLVIRVHALSKEAPAPAVPAPAADGTSETAS